MCAERGVCAGFADGLKAQGHVGRVVNPRPYKSNA